MTWFPCHQGYFSVTTCCKGSGNRKGFSCGSRLSSSPSPGDLSLPLGLRHKQWLSKPRCGQWHPRTAAPWAGIYEWFQAVPWVVSETCLRHISGAATNCVPELQKLTDPSFTTHTREAVPKSFGLLVPLCLHPETGIRKVALSPHCGIKIPPAKRLACTQHAAVIKTAQACYCK